MAKGKGTWVLSSHQGAMVGNNHDDQGVIHGVAMSLGTIDHMATITPGPEQLKGLRPFTQLQLHHSHPDGGDSWALGSCDDPEKLRLWAKQLRQAANAIELYRWRQANPEAELPQGVDVRG